MSISLTDLIQKLHSNTPDLVKAAKERFNNRIRESLRREATPGIRAAFKKLLPKQPARYHVQDQWTESTPEMVRYAMLGVRRTSNDGTPETFRELLRKAQAPLGVRRHSEEEEASALTQPSMRRS
jgi:hypothetical protein